jgi:protein disulfide-isomerase
MYIKKLIFSFCFFWITAGFSQESNKWLIDYEEVYQKSIEEDKPIMANFTGSDWCGWCKKLKKAVFDTTPFQKWAEENVILLELDYPRRTPQDPKIKEQNRQLQQTFREVVRGYPTVLIFDIERTYDGNEKKSDGIKIHGKMGYMGNPNDFINVAKNHISNRKK